MVSVRVVGFAAAALLGCFLANAAAQEASCGRARGSKSSSEQKGENVVIPGWHVVVYDKAGTKTTPSDMCAGALISSKFLVAAAHCFHDASDNLRPVTDFAIAVGKVFRSWDKAEDSAQHDTIKQIYTNGYVRRDGSHDIALVELNDAVAMNDRVWPICVDWKNAQPALLNGAEGSMAGFGSSESLKYFPLRFVDTQQCARAIPKELATFATADKFCADTAPGSAVSGVDSTCGFAQINDNLWFLRGVYSKTSGNRNLFADVAQFTGWMAGIVNRSADSDLVFPQ